MTFDIRHPHQHEYSSMHQFLDRSFSMGPRWFQINQPALARDDEEALKWNLVALDGDDIVAHVGTYPLALTADDVVVDSGGIGNVATKHEYRGQGLMSQLLKRSVDLMVNRGQTVSVLWGDRRRYGHFGWERAGWALHIDINRRHLDDVQPADVEEVDPTDRKVVSQVHRLHESLRHRVARTEDDMARKLRTPGIRLFLGEAGYVISDRYSRGNPPIVELSSPSGLEAELISATIDKTGGSGASLTCEYASSPRVGRLIAIASNWQLRSHAMFRINDWPRFAEKLAPLLGEAARGLAPFAVTVGCRSTMPGERPSDASVAIATFQWNGEAMTVTGEEEGDADVVLSDTHLVRLVFGAPEGTVPELGPLAGLFPLPFFVPSLDKV